MISTQARKRFQIGFNPYLKLVLRLSIFLIFVIGLYFLVDKVKTYFPIKSVKVYGVQYTDQSAIHTTVMPLVAKGFFAIDVEDIKDRLLQSPWVAQAAVQRIWPDQVIVRIIEKIPVARWNNNGLLSMSGEVFNPDTKSYPNGLPHFVGPEGQQLYLLKNYKKISSLLTSLHFKIAKLEVAPDFSWSMTLDNGMKLNVGHKDVLTRMNHFVKVYPKIIGTRFAAVDYVDLRYANGLAVRWKTIT